MSLKSFCFQRSMLTLFSSRLFSVTNSTQANCHAARYGNSKVYFCSSDFLLFVLLFLKVGGRVSSFVQGAHPKKCNYLFCKKVFSLVFLSLLQQLPSCKQSSGLRMIDKKGSAVTRVLLEALPLFSIYTLLPSYCEILNE